MDQSQRAFAQLVSDLNQAHPGIKFLGVTIFSTDVKDIKISNPDAAYWSTKSVVMTDLKSSVQDTTDAYVIFSTYQNLERNARFARCNYLDQDGAIIFTREINNLERISHPWINTVDAEP